jgi:hypothetical protein
VKNRTSNSQLSSKPLGAGDLIDRAVRFYRQNFWTYVLIASPPIILGTLCLVGWMFVMRNIFTVNASNPDEALLYQIFVSLGGILIWLIQFVAVLVVMGGSARNFVRHLLFEEPVTFRETYSNIRGRIGGLVVVSTVITVLLAIVAFVLFYIWLVVIVIGFAAIAFVGAVAPPVAVVAGVAFGIAATLGILWVFFLVVSRFVYIPQVMLVEGQGAFSAIGRSASLAGKNVTRVGALSVFNIVAIYVALMLLYLPLGLYAWTEGLDLVSFGAVDTLPAWYEISYRVIAQVSLILIIPVLMIGLCLLYVDERVKSEGYDIELMAVKRLGEIPDVPDEFINPLQPALSKQSRTTTKKTTSSRDGSTLGLS